VVLLNAILTVGCAGPLFRVKPVVELPPLGNNVKTATAEGLTLNVAPPLTDEESQELFEANLPLSGIAPVRLEILNTNQIALELKKARFSVHDSEGRDWKLLSLKQTISRIMKANNIYAYNPRSRKQFEAEFRAYGLDLKTPLAASERRQGFLFFQTPNKDPVTGSKGLVLQVEKLQQPVQVVLN